MVGGIQDTMARVAQLQALVSSRRLDLTPLDGPATTAPPTLPMAPATALGGAAPTASPAFPAAGGDFSDVLAAAMSRSTPVQLGGATAVGAPTEAPKGAPAAAVAFALGHVGDRYVFGANGPSTWDCSSLMQAAYRSTGLQLPRTAAEQATTGTPVDISPAAVKAGDLLFLHGGSPAHDLGHVGMAISSTEWVVAPHSGATVKVEPIPWSRLQRVRRPAADPTGPPASTLPTAVLRPPLPAAATPPSLLPSSAEVALSALAG